MTTSQDIDIDIEALVEAARGAEDASEIDVIIREVIDSKVPGCMISIARVVTGAESIDRLQSAVIDSGDAEGMTAFAAYVPGADVERLQEEVIACGDIADVGRFSARVPGADTARLYRVSIARRTWSPSRVLDGEDDDMSATDKRRNTLFKIAHEADDPEEIEVLTREVIDSGDAYDISAFAAIAPGADTTRLQEAVITIGNAEWMHFFAQQVPGADIARLQEAVIATGDVKVMKAFAKYIEGADTAVLEDAISSRS